MRLNLGCGRDIRDGYVNVDIHRPDVCGPNFQSVDLSKIPWPWHDGAADEILMLDFLEHFPYRQTTDILQEAWRVLKVGGTLEVQVPDFEICAAAVTGNGFFQCNVCGALGGPLRYEDCHQCGQSWGKIAHAAIARLYGGQDVVGNWHFTAFTGETLKRYLVAAGFGDFEWPALNQNGETFAQNWNIKVLSRKHSDIWGER